MTDRDLQEHVQKALDWEPSVDSANIGVSVENGVVTLRGDVRSYWEKAAAERVALRVYGVKAVANDVNVRSAGRGGTRGARPDGRSRCHQCDQPRPAHQRV
jgi:osmotically-inducible protein OsmY